MKNLFLILTILTFTSSSVLSQNIKIEEEIKTIEENSLEQKDIILELKPERKYDENLKYDEVQSYAKAEKKKDSNINLDVDINKETKTIDKLKLDMGTNF